MAIIKFSSSKHGINVEIDDTSNTCSGSYEGAAISSAVLTDKGMNCVILLDPDASKASAFENLLCIDREGRIIWRARLPTNPDVFVSLAQTSQGILTKTWSGMSLVLDPLTGRELNRKFVK
jgi:hypothetical protein